MIDGGRRWAAAVIAIAVLAVTAASLAPVRRFASQPASQAASPVKLFAFYYVWFDPSSWRRAKVDYPVLGNYSSDDPQVMRQHVASAKSAGIDGFIVSWKHTPTNDRRLRLLAQAARQADFRLAMIYQGLDFYRNPLPASTVAADFRFFQQEFARDPVFFRMGGKPLTILSGTWAFSRDDIAAITTPVRGDLLVLNTQKSVADYEKIADLTDGDAYYWSSVNPATNRNHLAKLIAMSEAVHADGKYWIAPFAPGFDARLVGGRNVVQRDDGATLRTEYAAAVRSSPDLLGLISWNEFSENTYVEPSQRYGHRYLDVLRELRGATALPPLPSLDSSEGQLTSGPVRVMSVWRVGSLIVVPVVLMLAVAAVGVHRRRGRRS